MCFVDMENLYANEIRNPPELTGPETYHACILYSSELINAALEIESKLIYNKFSVHTLNSQSSDDDIKLYIDQSLCIIIVISGLKDESNNNVFKIANKKMRARLRDTAALVLHETAVCNNFKFKLQNYKFLSYDETAIGKIDSFILEQCKNIFVIYN